MGLDYQGPAIASLPENIRERIQTTVDLVRNQIYGLGVMVNDLTDRFKQIKYDDLWCWGENKEVYVFDYDHLNNVYFRDEEKIYQLYFIGNCFGKEKDAVEAALGLEVTKWKQGLEAKLEGEELKLTSKGHGLLRLVATGPYLGRE